MDNFFDDETIEKLKIICDNFNKSFNNHKLTKAFIESNISFFNNYDEMIAKEFYYANKILLEIIESLDYEDLYIKKRNTIIATGLIIDIEKTLTENILHYFIFKVRQKENNKKELEEISLINIKNQFNLDGTPIIAKIDQFIRSRNESAHKNTPDIIEIMKISHELLLEITRTILALKSKF